MASTQPIANAQSLEGPNVTRIRTSPYLSKFEYAKLIGLRKMQLSQEVHQEKDIEESAHNDIEHKKLDWIVRRYLPEKLYEDVKLTDLIIPSSLLRQEYKVNSHSITYKYEG
jgi:hypothetical protein